jgi:hypothetical protein
LLSRGTVWLNLERWPNRNIACEIFRNGWLSKWIDEWLGKRSLVIEREVA